jgi:hypothetical protein
MVNDLSMKVRVQAAGLLGSLHLVSARYLQQTLDKKVMSHLKVSVGIYCIYFLIRLYFALKMYFKL